MHLLGYWEYYEPPPRCILGTIYGGRVVTTPAILRAIFFSFPCTLGSTSQGSVHLLRYWDQCYPLPSPEYQKEYHSRVYTPCDIESNILFSLYIRNYITGFCTPYVILGLMLSSPPLNVKNSITEACTFPVIWPVISSSLPLDTRNNITEGVYTPLRY